MHDRILQFTVAAVILGTSFGVLGSYLGTPAYSATQTIESRWPDDCETDSDCEAQYGPDDFVRAIEIRLHSVRA